MIQIDDNIPTEIKDKILNYVAPLEILEQYDSHLILYEKNLLTSPYLNESFFVLDIMIKREDILVLFFDENGIFKFNRKQP